MPITLWFFIRIASWFGSWQILLYLKKGCHQPRVERGEISFKEPWQIGFRGGALGHYFIYNGRGAVSAHSLIVTNTSESKIKPKSLFFSSPTEHVTNCQNSCLYIYFFFEKKMNEKRAGIHTQVLKLFFQQCARDGYSDQFQCRLALLTGQPSLVSNIRANPEPCNLQEFEIDQRIERSDGQSWKRRQGEPTDKKKKHRHRMGKKAPSYFAMRASLGSSFPSFFLFSLEMNRRTPALPSTPLPYSKTMSCQCQWLLLLLLLPLSC